MSTASVAVSLYALALILVVWYGRRQARSGDMFNVFGRRAGVVRATAGYLSLIGAGELVTISQLGYDNGLDLLWFPGGISAGFLILGLLGDGVRARAKAIGANTLVGYVDHDFGRGASIPLSVVFLTALGSLLTIQFIVGGQLLQVTTGLPAMATPAVMALVIVAYLLIGGYVAVLSTDLLRLAFLVVIVIVLAAVTMTQSGLMGGRAMIAFTSMPNPDRMTLFILGLFGAVCAGDVWQTVLASQSKAVLRRSMALAAVSFLALGLLIGSLGMAARQVSPTLPAETSALVAATQLVISSSLAPLVALMIAGSIMATADTEIWVLSSSFASLAGSTPATGESEEKYQDITRRRVRFLLPAVTATALILSYLTRDAQAIYEGLLILLTAIAPPIIAVMAGLRKPLAISLGLWAALLSFILLAAKYRMAIPSDLTFLPVASSLAALVLGLIIGKPPAFELGQ